MEHTKFYISFILTFALLAYFLGSSITGYYVYEPYCGEKGCYEYCMSATRCAVIRECCSKYGICREVKCEQDLDFDIGQIESLSTLESPYNNDPYHGVFYATLLISAVAIAFLYKKHSL